MSKTKRPSSMDPRDLAERVKQDVDRFVAENAADYVQAFLRLLTDKVPKARGRPEGSGEDDRELLDRMADLLFDGAAESEREAASMAAESLPEPARAATANRLRRKYAKRRDALNLSATERAEEDPKEPEDWEKAFIEDVEEWVIP